jgi:hypothetical protein
VEWPQSLFLTQGKGHSGRTVLQKIGGGTTVLPHAQERGTFEMKLHLGHFPLWHKSSQVCFLQERSFPHTSVQMCCPETSSWSKNEEQQTFLQRCFPQDLIVLQILVHFQFDSAHNTRFSSDPQRHSANIISLQGGHRPAWHCSGQACRPQASSFPQISPQVSSSVFSRQLVLFFFNKFLPHWQ